MRLNTLKYSKFSLFLEKKITSNPKKCKKFEHLNVFRRNFLFQPLFDIWFFFRILEATMTTLASNQIQFPPVLICSELKVLTLTIPIYKKKYIYSRRKYYCYHQNTKYLWCHLIIQIANIFITILDFSLLLLVQLSLLILIASFLVSVLCFFFYGSLSKVLARGGFKGSAGGCWHPPVWSSGGYKATPKIFALFFLDKDKKGRD